MGCKVKRALSCLGQALLSVMSLVLVLCILSSLFKPSPGDPTAYEKEGNVARANGILLEPSNTIDVLFVGDSEAYSSFSPLHMWREYGFTSYVCGTAGQQIPYSLSILRRATASQRPRVVVIEANVAYRPTTIECALGQVFQDVFPIFEFHNRWKSLLEPPADDGQSTAKPNATKGFLSNDEIKPADASEHMAEDDEIAEISQKNETYLQLMIGYCRSIGAPPILVSVPSTVNWSTALHNGIVEFAQKAHVTYIDLNVAPTQVQIDWSVDTRDAGDHMNNTGARKVSKYMGAYLSRTYGLVDRRGDANYQAWNEACALNGR